MPPNDDFQFQDVDRQFDDLQAFIEQSVLMISNQDVILMFIFIHTTSERSKIKIPPLGELDDAEVGLGEDRKEALADVGNNADLYVTNQESTDLINETHMDMEVEDVPLLRFVYGSRRICICTICICICILHFTFYFQSLSRS